MKFSYKKECSLKVGQELYGIIASTIYTHGGVSPIVVDEIDYNREKVIFEIAQPCVYVSCSFYEVERFVFESKEEANNKFLDFEIDEGLHAY
jgi:hypothetical protein